MSDIQIGALFGAAIGLIGCVAFLWSAVWLIRLGKRVGKGCTEEVYGYVIRNDKDTFYSASATSRKLHTAYRPVVRFKLPDGRTIERKHTIGANPAKYQVGDHILIKYDPENPSHFVLPMDTNIEWFPVIFLIMFGILALVMAVLFGRMLILGPS